MARFPLGPLVKGLSTLVDPAAGDPQSSPELKDVRGHTGILTNRKGFRVLAIEPSHKQTSNDATKAWGYLGFDGVNDYATNAAWTQTLGQKWTIRLWTYALSLSGVNDTTGTRTLLHIPGTLQDPVLISIIGASGGSTAQIRAIVKDKDGTTATITGTARTTSAWVTRCGNHAIAYIRLVRNGSSVSLYVGEQQEGTTQTLSSAAHEASTALWVAATSGPTAGTYCNMQTLGLSIVNRVLTEAECYWGIGWPSDDTSESDILGNWPFVERAGTTVADYSSYDKTLTITGATWTGALFAHARGLGLKSWRRANGDIYYIIAATRRGTSSAGASPSGAIYVWKASETFVPFYFGGDPGADDATAGLSGLHPLARWDFAQGRDMVIGCNGRDYCRKYRASFQYLGGTAPPTKPILGSTGTGITGTFGYAYSYFNSTTKTETGLSPLDTITVSNKTVTVQWFLSSDTQFSHVRIYRTKTGETALYLLTEQTMAAAAYSDTRTDASLIGAPLAPGSDLPGNRNRKRAFLAFPDFPVADTPTTTGTGPGNRGMHNAGARKAPVTAPTLAESGTASVNAGVHYFAYSYYDSVNDVETGMSPAAAITATGGMQVDVSAMVLPPEGSRYNQIRLYRTKAGAFTWYLAQSFTAAATATETQADSALTTTIETYSLPPKFEGMAVFANRLWGFVGPNLCWSTHGFFEDHPEANQFAAKSGVNIRAIAATDSALFVSYSDGTIHALPHPGDEPDLSYFVPLNLRQWSPRGGATGHFTQQAVPGGILWLSRDGFYLASPSGGLTLVSPQISPDFLNLNGSRARYACSLYDGTRGIYRCWLSRGNNRLNEECFVFYLNDGTWWLDTAPHADAAGILYDAKENPHFCVLMENGILHELDDTLDYDADGSGTLTGTMLTPTIVSFADIAGRTAPTGGDGGYPIWAVKSDGTMIQRTKLDPAMDPRGDVDNVELFYPASTAIISGTWTAYFHGIRGYFKTMLLHFGDLRFIKNLMALFFFNRVQSAGGMQVNLATDEGTLTAVNQDVDLTKAVSQVTSQAGSGRAFQLEVYSDPPAASRPWGLKGMEFEGSVDESDVGT